jgi:hypothetical protein
MEFVEGNKKAYEEMNKWMYSSECKKIQDKLSKEVDEIVNAFMLKKLKRDK